MSSISTYLPAFIWLLSAVVCHVIAKRRRVGSTALMAMAVTLLGPLAIPLVLAAASGKSKPA